jgi:crotonobetainyl-CoA:carnitine CoA-transferase CaiB-like acyl-CoA transferase
VEDSALPYSLLSGIRVIELSLLAPDLLGMHLADLGAEVIKLEQPPTGDYVREIGSRKLGGLSLMHLRWNRGKRSVLLDLKRAEAQALLGQLVERSHVLIDGLRPGAAERCGAGYEGLRAKNPSLVYCSLSGFGRTGPYASLATHGVAYDAFAGLAPPARGPDGSPRIPPHTQVGIHAAPLYAASAVCAALVRARTTGTGCRLDMAELDAAVAWQAEALGGAHGDVPRRTDLSASVRYQYYATRDDRVVIFQASERKFWKNFCDGVGRSDLYEAKPGARVGDHAAGDEALRRELAALFRTRTRAEWVEFFMEHDVPGAPVYEPDELPDDPQVRARELLIEQHHPVAGALRLFGTPLQVEGERFQAAPAPAPGEHTDEVLGRVLGLGAAEIARLRSAGIAA